jgi:hypothetical protein
MGRPKWNQERMGVNLKTEEFIFWHWSKKVGKDGKLKVTYPKEIRNPGCKLPFTPKNVKVDAGKDSISFEGPAGKELELDCYGIVRR